MIVIGGGGERGGLDPIAVSRIDVTVNVTINVMPLESGGERDTDTSDSFPFALYSTSISPLEKIVIPHAALRLPKFVHCDVFIPRRNVPSFPC